MTKSSNRFLLLFFLFALFVCLFFAIPFDEMYFLLFATISVLPLIDCLLCDVKCCGSPIASFTLMLVKLFRNEKEGLIDCMGVIMSMFDVRCGHYYEIHMYGHLEEFSEGIKVYPI